MIAWLEKWVTRYYMYSIVKMIALKTAQEQGSCDPGDVALMRGLAQKHIEGFLQVRAKGKLPGVKLSQIAAAAVAMAHEDMLHMMAKFDALDAHQETFGSDPTAVKLTPRTEDTPPIA